jgi:EmrB/QacA subfamily drug resistance transporter
MPRTFAIAYSLLIANFVSKPAYPSGTHNNDSLPARSPHSRNLCSRTLSALAGLSGMKQTHSARRLFFRIFPSIVLPMFMAVAEQTMIATALPEIGTALGDLERISWVVTGYLVAAAVSAPVYGVLGDVFGYRRTMLVSILLYVLGALASALAPNFAWLVAARILQGLGGGGLMTSSQALVGATIPPRERGRYQGYLATVVVIAATSAPVLGGIITELFGWRYIFCVGLLLAAVAVPLVLQLPPQQGRPDSWRLDGVGLVLFILAISSLLLGIEGLRTGGGAVLLAASALIFAALLAWERRADHPIISIDLLAKRPFWAANLMIVFHGATIVGLVTMLPSLMRIGLGLQPSDSAFLLVGFSLGIAIGSMSTGWLISRTGRLALFPSLGLPLAAMLLATLALGSTIFPLPGIAVLLLALGVSLGTTMPVAQVTTQHTAGPSAAGRASGFVQLARSVGAGVGTALLATVLIAALDAQDPIVSTHYGELLKGGPQALGDAFPGQREEIATAVRNAVGAVYFTLSGLALLGGLAAWVNPLRKV